MQAELLCCLGLGALQGVGTGGDFRDASQPGRRPRDWMLEPRESPSHHLFTRRCPFSRKAHLPWSYSQSAAVRASPDPGLI